jgi:hypothetical protein
MMIVFNNFLFRNFRTSEKARNFNNKMGHFRFEILAVAMILISVVYGGYFSSHSGSVLNRNGNLF